MSKAGDFEITAWRGGYPVMCVISYKGEQIARISHTELSDLEYAVKKAMNEAISVLPECDKWEVKP